MTIATMRSAVVTGVMSPYPTCKARQVSQVKAEDCSLYKFNYAKYKTEIVHARVQETLQRTTFTIQHHLQTQPDFRYRAWSLADAKLPNPQTPSDEL